MNRLRAAIGSAIFFAVAPVVVAGLIPWWLTGWHALDFWLPLRVFGAVLIMAATAVVVSCFVRFVVEGIGTPAPVAPPQHLVVGGFYRYVRNPIYVALVTAIVGQALLLGQPALVVYGAIVLAFLVAFVRFYEELDLAERFGADYDAYRRNVPGWRPRLRPWRP